MTVPTEAPIPPTAESSTPSATDATTGTLDALQQWLHSLRAICGRAAALAVMETRLATVNIALILILAVASGLLLASAWIAFFGVVVVGLHSLGLAWPWAFLLIGAVNLALAFGGAYAIYRLSNNLLMQTLRRFILASESSYDGPANQSASGPTTPAH